MKVNNIYGKILIVNKKGANKMFYKVIALINDDQMVMGIFPSKKLASDYCIYLEDQKIDSKIVTYENDLDLWEV